MKLRIALAAALALSGVAVPLLAAPAASASVGAFACASPTAFLEPGAHELSTLAEGDTAAQTLGRSGRHGAFGAAGDGALCPSDAG